MFAWWHSLAKLWREASAVFLDLGGTKEYSRIMQALYSGRFINLWMKGKREWTTKPWVA